MRYAISRHCFRVTAVSESFMLHNYENESLVYPVLDISPPGILPLMPKNVLPRSIRNTATDSPQKVSEYYMQ